MAQISRSSQSSCLNSLSNTRLETYATSLGSPPALCRGYVPPGSGPFGPPRVPLAPIPKGTPPWLGPRLCAHEVGASVPLLCEEADASCKGLSGRAEPSRGQQVSDSSWQEGGPRPVCSLFHHDLSTNPPASVSFLIQKWGPEPPPPGSVCREPPLRIAYSENPRQLPRGLKKPNCKVGSGPGQSPKTRAVTSKGQGQST